MVSRCALLPVTVFQERERERERGIYEEGNSMDGDPGKRLVRRRRGFNRLPNVSYCYTYPY